MTGRGLVSLLTFLALGAVGCSDPDPATQVMVVFDADRVVQRVARDIEITAFGGPRGDALPRENVQTFRFNIRQDLEPPCDEDAPPNCGWPVTHTLVPLEGDATRLFQVEGRLFDDDGQPIAHARALSGYLDRRTLVLRLRFYANCLYQDACDDEDFSCNAEGNCQLARAAPAGLPDLPPGGTGMTPDGGVEPACRTPLDCDDGVACTVESCIDGVCANRPDDGLCMNAMGSGTCNGELGCQYGACTPDNCQPEGCDATAMCNAEGECVRVSNCRPAEPCCGNACGTCNDRNPCTTNSCDPTTSECVSEPAVGNCNDGVFCNGEEACVDGACSRPGTRCPGMSMCDEEENTCTGCVDDADCPSPFQDPNPADCVPNDVSICDASGIMVFQNVSYTCNAGTCDERRDPVSMSCTIPGVIGMDCGFGSLMWGTCTPVDLSDECNEEGDRRGTADVLQCSTTGCDSVVGESVTNETCTVSIPSRCRDTDTGTVDTGTMDSGTMDSGTIDTGTTDTGTVDTGTTDTGTTDTGTTDSGTMDSGTTDTGTTDSGTTDSGTTDTSTSDDSTVTACADPGGWDLQWAAGCAMGSGACLATCGDYVMNCNAMGDCDCADGFGGGMCSRRFTGSGCGNCMLAVDDGCCTTW